MKNAKALILCCLMIITFTSCDEEKVEGKIEEYPGLSLAVAQFQNTDFYRKSTLDKYVYKFEQGSLEKHSNKNLLIVPVDNSLSMGRAENITEVYSVSVFDENMNYEKSIEISNLSAISLQENAGDFTGGVNIQIPDGLNDSDHTLTVNFQNGVFTDFSVDGSASTDGRVECCGCSTRGVMYCTGKKFEDAEGNIEEIFGCYLGFLPCLAYRAADCVISECS